MDGQTAIVVPEGPTPLGPCRWCDEPAVSEIEIEKARFGMHGGVQVIRRRPITVPVCRVHVRILDHQPSC